ncbi:metal-dependent hydrolase [Paenibacillus sp. 1011MAR3C5]|uniref:metal-dependent hydrolase n=1 Tax=Paenibacillus sp. 1011MAR3C5 TaxID=1675787 RepID=UPI000E6D3EBE|nr:metal-dependent hydrolase [Paenibacillus sp. 1011MAR3C5]RJE88816.1 metal-dependent hydrolase [Paenibacillus sp. 1011MAR3C5]
MRGKTHLAIGAVVGAGAAAFYSSDLSESHMYIGIAAFSALCPDLDGPSILSSKITKASKKIRELALWGGILYLGIILFLWLTGKPISPLAAGGSLAAVLIGLTMKQGAIRNALVSAVGLYLVSLGTTMEELWLIGLGVFVIIAPWLKHRGMTHTIWLLPIWWWLGLGLEQYLNLDGIAVTAMLGYLSHLAADTLTPSGVKWLYPLTKKSFKLKL